MNLTRDRLRSIGWGSLLVLSTALTFSLTLRVNAVKSEVSQAERRIVALRGEIAFLETEYQTRSNQQQLKSLNDVEFGYTAPRAGQYIEGERYLAALGTPRAPGAPKPIRIASAVADDKPASFLQMVSPVASAASLDSGAGPVPARSASRPVTADGGQSAPARDPIGAAIDAESLSQRLARSGPVAARPE